MDGCGGLSRQVIDTTQRDPSLGEDHPFLKHRRDGHLLFDGVDDVAEVTDSDALDLVGNVLMLSYWVKRRGVRGETLIKKADSSASSTLIL